jgi:hypothetical protein
MVMILAIAAIFMQIVVGEDPHFDGVRYSPRSCRGAVDGLAALALFETLPVCAVASVMSPGFVWSILGIGLPEISGNLHVDPMGLMVVVTA